MDAEPESKLDPGIKDVNATKAGGDLKVADDNNNIDGNDAKVSEEEESALWHVACGVDEEVLVADDIEISCGVAAGEDLAAANKCEDGPGRMVATFARRLRDVASMDDVEATEAARNMMAAWADAGECYETLKKRYEEQRAGATGGSSSSSCLANLVYLRSDNTMRSVRDHGEFVHHCAVGLYSMPRLRHASPTEYIRFSSLNSKAFLTHLPFK